MARHKWTDEELALLGTTTDVAVARAIGVQPQNVTKMRQRRHIEKYKNDCCRSTTIDVSLLGTMSDRRLANLYGCKWTQVRHDRVMLGIESHKATHAFQWTDGLLLQVGTKADADLARDLVIPVQSIYNARRKHGLPIYRPRSKCVICGGPMPANCKASKTRCSIRCDSKHKQRVASQRGRPEVSELECRRLIKAMQLDLRRRLVPKRRKWTKAMIEMLGTMPDKVLADSLGLPRSVVTCARGYRRIPRTRQRRPLKADSTLLGVISDRALARQLGLSPAEVRFDRITCGIDSSIPHQKWNDQVEFHRLRLQLQEKLSQCKIH